MIRVLIVDDHQMVGEGTKNMIEQENDFDVTYIREVEFALKISLETPFDVYLLDINMPGYTGIELSRRILKHQIEAKIILYTGFEYASQFNLLVDSGISGIVSKSASQDELLTAIRSVLNGYTLIPITLLHRLRLPNESDQEKGMPLKKASVPVLTQKELKMLESIAEGKGNKEIADDLFMSIRAVEYNLTKIYKKLNVNSRSEALVEAMREGVIDIS